MALWFWIYQLTLTYMACFHLAHLAHLFVLWPQNLSRLLQQCKSLYHAWTLWHCQISICFKISVLKFCTDNSQGSQCWFTVRILNNRYQKAILAVETNSGFPLCVCTPVNVGAHMETRGQPQVSHSGRPLPKIWWHSLPLWQRCKLCFYIM